MSTMALEFPHHIRCGSTLPATTIRPSSHSDQRALERLSELEDSDPGSAPHLVAEQDGEVVASLSLRDDVALGDPFRPTAEVISVLRACATHVSPRRPGGRRLVRRVAALASTAMIAVAALALGAANATASPQAKPLTGTWTGTTEQEIFLVDPTSGETASNEWSVRMTVTALNGRLVSVSTTVRVVCGGPAVRDLLIRHGWKVNRKGVSAGPALGKHGSFSVRLADSSGKERVSIAGALKAGSAMGRFDTTTGGCSGKGSWKLKRVL
jgi:hypothetical protein